MKLKKLLVLDFMQEFQSLLVTDFEHKLFIASLRNYASHGNPLRFHNFAFSMRELVLHVINRKAPPGNVVKASWYQRESEDHPVTRRQQIKYIAQTNLSDAYLGNDVIEDMNEYSKEFLAEFRFFNRYTHITEKYFETCPQTFFENVKLVVKIANDSLRSIYGIEQLIADALTDKVRDSVIRTAINSIPDNLSILANHVYVDFTEVEEIELTGKDDTFLYVTARGTIHVVQEYGPKDDLCEMNVDYPFSLAMKSCLEDPERFEVIGEELDIDTSSWYE